MTQHPLANPYAHVHPLFWPVLWLSLRAFAAWSGRMIEDGHGFAGLAVELTCYGWIHVTHLDLSPQRAAFHRHMAGIEDESWQARLAAHRARVGRLAARGAHSTPALACMLQDTAAAAPLAPPSPLRGSRARDERRDLRHKHRSRRARPPPLSATRLSPQSALSFHRTASAAAATGAGGSRSSRLQVSERCRTCCCGLAIRVPLSRLRERGQG